METTETTCYRARRYLAVHLLTGPRWILSLNANQNARGIEPLSSSWVMVGAGSVRVTQVLKSNLHQVGPIFVVVRSTVKNITELTRVSGKRERRTHMKHGIYMGPVLMTCFIHVVAPLKYTRGRSRRHELLSLFEATNPSAHRLQFILQ